MRHAFDEHGVLILERFASSQQCQQLVSRASSLVERFDANAHASVFSTRSQAHARDSYFAESGDKVRFFFEEDAFDGDGRLRQSKSLSINKIGHALHDLDPVFKHFSRTSALAALCKELGVVTPLLIQSMFIFKQPRIGGAVDWHQDASFLYTEPSSVIGLWFALEDATQHNGCMYALPGMHRSRLCGRFKRGEHGLSFERDMDVNWTPANAKALPAKQGTLVVLHGHLPHFSESNRSNHSRHAYALHVIDGECSYAHDNWLHRAANFPARGF